MCQDCRAPGQQQAEYVAQVVTGVGQQGERAGQQAECDFDENECEVQSDADREGAIVAYGRMQVTSGAVPMFGVASVEAASIILHFEPAKSTRFRWLSRSVG